MSAAELLNTCPVCGAEESLDALLLRMIDDDQVRRLIAEVVELSLPLGGLVVRYLRLHKPPKQRLRMKRVHELLTELITDMRRGEIQRKGRCWPAPAEAWKAGFAAVFEAVEHGTLRPPLQGNGYLYQVMTNLADKLEGEAERINEANRRQRGPVASSATDMRRGADGMHIATALGAIERGEPVVAAAPLQAAPAPAPQGPSPYARRLRAELDAMRRARTGETQPEGDQP